MVQASGLWIASGGGQGVQLLEAETGTSYREGDKPSAPAARAIHCAHTALSGTPDLAREVKFSYRKCEERTNYELLRIRSGTFLVAFYDASRTSNSTLTSSLALTPAFPGG